MNCRNDLRSTCDIRRSHEPAREAARVLGFVRAAVFGIWCFKAATASLAPLAELPPAVIEPVGVMLALSSPLWQWLLRGGVLTVFQVLLTVSVTLGALGARPYRPIALVACALLTIHQSLLRSFGHVNHQEISLLLATYVLAIFPAGDEWVWPRRLKALRPAAMYAAPVVLIAALLLMPYAGSAAYRIAHHGWVTFTGASIPGFVIQNSFNHGFEAIGRFVLERPLLLRSLALSAPVVAMFELAAPVALVSRRFRYVWLFFAVIFHLSTWLFMHIFFWDSLLLAFIIVPALDRVSEALLPSNPDEVP